MNRSSNAIKQKLAVMVLAAITGAPASAGAQAPPPSMCPLAFPAGTHPRCDLATTPDGRAAWLCRVVDANNSQSWCWVPPGGSVPYTREEPPFVEPGMPNLNVGVGRAFTLDSTQRDDGFSWHILPSVGLTLGGSKAFGIRPELGYAQERLGDEMARLFVAGVGPMWLPLESPGLELRYAPRFVVGKAGETAVGFRHGVVAQAVYGVIGIELSHQALWVDGTAQHDGRLLFTFDPAVMLVGLAVGTAIAIWGVPGG